MGYKLAHPMLSADGAGVGFAGVSLGRSHVYGVVSEGVCVLNPRHRPPVRFCNCGFYCFHSVQSAQALACDTRYRSTVLLEVLASGRYVRYDDGLRCSRQRVRAVQVGACDCGRPVDVLVDAGTGRKGWRRLAPACALCAGWRPAVTLGGFARMAGHELRVQRAADVDLGASGARPLSTRVPEADADSDRMVPVLAAEVALLQARLDDLQEHMDRLSRPDA